MKKALLVAAILTPLASPAHALCGDQGVFVFGAYWCPSCRAMETFLANYGIEHQRFEVTNNQEVQQFMHQNFGGTAIPVIIVDGNYKVGYDAQWLQGALCLR
jgi:glutaredoxin